MASGKLECIFCKENFTNQTQFWVHMSKGFCQDDSNAHSAQRNEAGVSSSLTKSDFASEEKLNSVSLQTVSETGNRNSQSFELNGLKAALKPSSSDVLPESAPSSSETINSPFSLFNKREFPSIDNLNKCTRSDDVPIKSDYVVGPVGSTTKPSDFYPKSSGDGSFPKDGKSQVSGCLTTKVLPQQPPTKWKCSLCNIEFIEKAAMISHIKSPEHEAKISFNSFSGDASSRNDVMHKITPTTTSNITTEKDHLTEMVRGIIRQELPAMLRQELGSLFEAFLKIINNGTERSSPCPTPLPSSPVETNIDWKYIKMQGTSIRCEACDCLLTSAANLPVHLEGKKHKTNVAKLGCSETF